jgi:hypothetical protein
LLQNCFPNFVQLFRGLRQKAENNDKDISTWSQIKDQVYGEKGTERRDNFEREAESFKIGLLLKKTRESRHMTQEELKQLVDKKNLYFPS